jgi:GTP 3',8-cyclase
MQYIHGAKIFDYPERLIDFKKGNPCKPITVAIHATNQCNCKCSYCNYQRLRGSDMLSDNEWATILGKLKAEGVQGINITGGGEPLLNPYLKKAVELAKKLGFNLGLITNGICLDQFHDHIKYFDWIRVSIDTDNREDYLKIRGVDEFDRVIHNLEQAVELKRELFLGTTIGTHAVAIPENIDNLTRMAYFYKDIGVDYFQFRPEEQTEYTLSDFNKIELGVIPVAKALETADFQVLTSPYKWEKMRSQERIYSKCYAADFIGAIDARGNWFVCCHWVGYPYLCYGNLITESLGAILPNKKLVQARINVTKCQIDCRGTMLNEALHGLKHPVHEQFL